MLMRGAFSKSSAGPPRWKYAQRGGPRTCGQRAVPWDRYTAQAMQNSYDE